MEKCQEQVPQFSSHKDSDMLGCPQSWHKWTEEPNVHDVFPTSHLYPNYEPPPTPEYLAWSWLKPSTQQNTHKLSTTKSLQPLVMARRGELAFKISSNNTMGAITHFYSLPLWNKYLKETGRRTIRAIKYLCSTVYWAFSCLFSSLIFTTVIQGQCCNYCNPILEMKGLSFWEASCLYKAHSVSRRTVLQLCFSDSTSSAPLTLPFLLRAVWFSNTGNGVICLQALGMMIISRSSVVAFC